MTLPVVVTERAEADLTEVIDWYEQQRAGIGKVFRAKFELTARQIERFPESFEQIDLVYRRAVLGRFPYFVAYRVLPDSVRILRVLPERGDPTTHSSLISDRSNH
jgi:plasmid stabilization system protein ParE